jgi:hypothetical protein
MGLSVKKGVVTDYTRWRGPCNGHCGITEFGGTEVGGMTSNREAGEYGGYRRRTKGVG